LQQKKKAIEDESVKMKANKDREQEKQDKERKEKLIKDKEISDKEKQEKALILREQEKADREKLTKWTWAKPPQSPINLSQDGLTALATNGVNFCVWSSVPIKAGIRLKFEVIIKHSGSQCAFLGVSQKPPPPTSYSSTLCRCSELYERYGMTHGKLGKILKDFDPSAVTYDFAFNQGQPITVDLDLNQFVITIHASSLNSSKITLPKSDVYYVVCGCAAGPITLKHIS